MKKKKGAIDIIGFGVGAIVLLVLIIIVASTIQTVPAGHRGILIEWNAVKSQTPLGEGLRLVTPIIQRVEIMDIRTQKHQTTCDSASKDLQQIFSDVALNYHIDPSRAVQIYQNIGKEYQDRIISPAIEEAVKTSTAQFTSEELITKREDAKLLMKDELKERLEPYGIIVETISIVNFDFNDAFDEAIERKVTQEQKTLEAQRKLEQIKFEAQQLREQAQGEADALLSKATAEAEAIRIQGEALKENPKVVSLRWIEKWDGVLPSTNLGTNAVPLIDISSN